MEVADILYKILSVQKWFRPLKISQTMIFVTDV